STTITGPAGATLAVSGGGLSRVFQINQNVTAFISGLTITGGSSGTTYGGGILTNGNTTLSNCTVSGNSAPSDFVGGGLFTLAGTTTVTNCTFAANTGGAIWNQNSSIIKLMNCTISGNTAGTYASGVVTFGGMTLTNTIVAGNSGADTNGTFSGDHNIIGGTPLLAPLGNYGGQNKTFALLPGSPAINAGTSTGASSTDQRHLARVGNVDIGAVEAQIFNFSTTTGSGQSAPVFSAFSSPLTVKITSNNGEPVAGGQVTFTP